MKWKLLTLLIFITVSGSLLINSCNKLKPGNPGNTPLAFEIPPGFPQPVYDFSSNPLTKEGFELGRKLFYDGILSIDGQFPCASCHQQIAIFGTYDHDLSHGYNDQHSDRNAPGLFNLAWHHAFHADGKYKTLEEECLDPIQAPNQMADNINNVLNKLKNSIAYRGMFEKAFGSSSITEERLKKALAQFTVSMVTSNSKYDQVKRGQNSFTDYELRGYALFNTYCASCHPEPMFTDYSYRNTGLALRDHLNDYGRMRVTGKSEDSLKFRVPSLRNVSLTYPYMHDGRYASLDACIKHYGSSVQPGPTLDPLLSTPIVFDSNQIIDLVAFLRTLTDSVLVKDPRFADPG